MIKIAIVDDDKEFLDQILVYIKKYCSDNKESYHTSCFYNGVDFLTDYKKYDLVILDIEMPLMNGMRVAQKLREIDESVVLLFITQTARFAVSGYEVSALDYVLKPLNYKNFAHKFKRALDKISDNAGKFQNLTVKTEDGLFTVSADKIYFIEKEEDYLVYHTSSGEFKERGTIYRLEEQLDKTLFSKGNKGCLINLMHVQSIRGDIVYLPEKNAVPLSRGQKKQFISEYFRYINGD